MVGAAPPEEFVALLRTASDQTGQDEHSMLCQRARAILSYRMADDCAKQVRDIMLVATELMALIDPMEHFDGMQGLVVRDRTWEAAYAHSFYQNASAAQTPEGLRRYLEDVTLVAKEDGLQGEALDKRINDILREYLAVRRWLEAKKGIPSIEISPASNLSLIEALENPWRSHRNGIVATSPKAALKQTSSTTVHATANPRKRRRDSHEDEPQHSAQPQPSLEDQPKSKKQKRADSKQLKKSNLIPPTIHQRSLTQESDLNSTPLVAQDSLAGVIQQMTEIKNQRRREEDEKRLEEDKKAQRLVQERKEKHDLNKKLKVVQEQNKKGKALNDLDGTPVKMEVPVPRQSHSPGLAPGDSGPRSLTNGSQGSRASSVSRIPSKAIKLPRTLENSYEESLSALNNKVIQLELKITQNPDASSGLQKKRKRRLIALIRERKTLKKKGRDVESSSVQGENSRINAPKPSSTTKENASGQERKEAKRGGKDISSVPPAVAQGAASFTHVGRNEQQPKKGKQVHAQARDALRLASVSSKSSSDGSSDADVDMDDEGPVQISTQINAQSRLGRSPSVDLLDLSRQAERHGRIEKKKRKQDNIWEVPESENGWKHTSENRMLSDAVIAVPDDDDGLPGMPNGDVDMQDIDEEDAESESGNDSESESDAETEKSGTPEMHRVELDVGSVSKADTDSDTESSSETDSTSDAESDVTEKPKHKETATIDDSATPSSVVSSDDDSDSEDESASTTSKESSASAQSGASRSKVTSPAQIPLPESEDGSLISGAESPARSLRALTEPKTEDSFGPGSEPPDQSRVVSEDDSDDSDSSSSSEESESDSVSNASRTSKSKSPAQIPLPRSESESETSRAPSEIPDSPAESMRALTEPKAEDSFRLKSESVAQSQASEDSDHSSEDSSSDEESENESDQERVPSRSASVESDASGQSSGSEKSNATKKSDVSMKSSSSNTSSSDEEVVEALKGSPAESTLPNGVPAQGSIKASGSEGDSDADSDSASDSNESFASAESSASGNRGSAKASSLRASSSSSSESASKKNIASAGNNVPKMGEESIKNRPLETSVESKKPIQQNKTKKALSTSSDSDSSSESDSGSDSSGEFDASGARIGLPWATPIRRIKRESSEN